MAWLPAWWHERQVRPDNFISASNSCQKIWQNRFFVIGKQKEMRKEKTFWHLPSLLTQESWSKVCKTCNKHCFRSYVKKQCARHLLWNRGELGQGVNTNGGQKAVVACIFQTSVETKEVKRNWFFPRLVDDIERKTFCDYIVEMLILCFVFVPIYCLAFIDGIE